MSDEKEQGLARGLTNYGDRDFSVYLRNSFAALSYSPCIVMRPETADITKENTTN